MKTKTQVKTKGYKTNVKSDWKTKPYKGKKYKKRRKEDTASTTLDSVMSVFKYIIYLTPICCCIMATWGDPALYTKWMMTAVHTLSLSILVQLADN